MNTYMKWLGVSIALGCAWDAQAFTLGEPGEAILVPYVLYESANNINTVVGITVPLEIGDDPVQHEANNEEYLDDGFTTAHQEQDTECDLDDPALPTGTIHWWFFDTTGNILEDSTLNTGCDYFVGLDWGTVVQSLGNEALDGEIGFLLFANQGATDGSSGAEFTLYGDAALIRGNWQSAAFIPVVPLTDSADDGDLVQGLDEVIYTSDEPSQFSPLTAGMPTDNHDGRVEDNTLFDVRYFFEPSLNASTDIVVWLDRNCRGISDGCDRRGVIGDVFDTDGDSVRESLDLSQMLNVIDAFTLSTPSDATSGFVRIQMPEVVDTGDGPQSAGVAFSLIRFSTPGNPEQVQTALAHERGTR